MCSSPLLFSPQFSEEHAPPRRPWWCSAQLGRLISAVLGWGTASHDIRLRRSTLAPLNVPFWKTSEESLIAWFARIGLPQEFQAGIDHISSVDIVAFQRAAD